MHYSPSHKFQWSKRFIFECVCSDMVKLFLFPQWERSVRSIGSVSGLNICHLESIFAFWINYLKLYKYCKFWTKVTSCSCTVRWWMIVFCHEFCLNSNSSFESLLTCFSVYVYVCVFGTGRHILYVFIWCARMHALSLYNVIMVSACTLGLSKPLQNRQSNLVGC